MVTPFKADGAVDEAALRALIDLFISEGASGVVVAGSTGEWYTLDDRERISLIEKTVSHVAGRITVIAGTSAIATRETVALTRAAKDAGADGCMVLPPPYCMPGKAEVIAHMEAVAAVGLPVMVYNNPPRTGVNIDAAGAQRMAEIDGVVAFKDSQRDLYQLAETIYAVGDKLAVFAGLEPYALPALHRGAVGIVSTIANLIAEDVVACQAAATSGAWADAFASQQRIDKAYHLMAAVGAPNYVFVKAAMAALGRPGGFPRLPHLPLDAATGARVADGLSRMGLSARGVRRAAE
jgi:4-hydroxy-tetrahydrodipicolinate synthase